MHLSIPQIRFISICCILMFITQFNPTIGRIINLCFLFLGTVEALRMLRKTYVLTSVLFFSHIMMTYFIGWILLNIEKVFYRDIFDFSVFTKENLIIALTSLTLADLTVFITYIRVTRKKENRLLFEEIKTILMSYNTTQIKRSFFLSILILSFALGAFVYFTNTSIIEVPYPFQTDTQWISYTCYKIPVIMACIALLLAYHQKTYIGPWFVNFARINFVFTIVFWLLYSGSRGFVTFLSVVFAMFEIYLFKLKYCKPYWSIAFMIIALWLYFCWPHMRTMLAYAPIDVVFIKSFFLALTIFDSMGQGDDDIILSNFPLIGMSLFHFLYTIQLIKDGISLEGITFLNLIPQSMPTFVYDVFGAERPLNDNTKLGLHYNHLGGFFSFANAYWNGGIITALLFMLILTLFFIWFDRRLFQHNTSNIYRALYLIYLPVVIIQFFYGVQGLVRAIEILAIGIFVDKYYRAFSNTNLKRF